MEKISRTMIRQSMIAKSTQNNFMGNVMRRWLFIKDANTPNPHSRKFMPGKPVMTEGGTMDFSAIKYTHVSPMARQLFGIDGVTRVFYGKDFISVSKEEEIEWECLKPEILGVITDHYTKGLPLFTEELPPDDTAILSDDTEAVQMIKEIIETRIRPFVQEDGGDITYLDFEEEQGLVTIEMKGSCAGCPSSAVTLKSGIEGMLKHYVQEVDRVEAVDYSGKE